MVYPTRHDGYSSQELIRQTSLSRRVLARREVGKAARSIRRRFDDVAGLEGRALEDVGVGGVAVDADDS